MKILVISSRLPYPPDTGGTIRLFHLYSRLGRNHSITWVSPVWSGHEPYIKDALQFCDQVIPIDPEGVQLPTTGWRNLLMRVVAHLHWERLFAFCFGYVNTPGVTWNSATSKKLAVINQVMSASSFDAIICETIGSVELTPRTSRIPTIISLWDIHSELFRRLRSIAPGTIEDRLFYLPELLKIRRYEARYYRDFTAAVTVSNNDKAHLARLSPELPVGVVGNGVDTNYFRPDGDLDIDGCLLFVASYGYPPNVDAAHFFCTEILPIIRSRLPEVTFWVVGRDAPADLGCYPGVKVMSDVPDVRPYLEQASVVVVPLRAGSGTRIKILEALAMGKAVVSTTLGAEGLEVEHGKHLLLADKPADFAQAVIDLVRDRPRRAALGQDGRVLVENRYSWVIQAKKFEAFVTDVVDKQNSVA
jgi:polysaccharide biosynthesis protein PslH